MRFGFKDRIIRDIRTAKPYAANKKNARRIRTGYAFPVISRYQDLALIFVYSHSIGSIGPLRSEVRSLLLTELEYFSI